MGKTKLTSNKGGGSILNGLGWLALVGVVLVGGVGVVGVTSGSMQIGKTVEVTEDMLLDPDPSDWLNWRRTLDGWGYSPLAQVTRENVSSLQLVWSWTRPPGTDEVTPLVYNGVMFLPGRNSIQALDAENGDLVWEFTRSIQADGGSAESLARRNLAIFDDKIYAATSDAHLIAISATTGRQVWEYRVADPSDGYSYSSGPIIAKGRVVAGMTGCSRYKEDVCFVSAHDPQTGSELWRTSTIAGPGEPGGDTWGDLPLAFRAGGDAWLPGSYDADSDLIYWSTAQAKPWTSAQRGTDGAALYTNSTLAIDPETGDLEWYYQHIPSETHDLDEAYEAVIVDNGSSRSLFKMGKIGVLWELDSRTGAFRNAFDLGYQNVLTINPTTGEVLLRPETIPRLGVPVDYCPGRGGLKNLWAMAYHPETHAFYIPLTPGCSEGAIYPEMPDEPRLGASAYGPSVRPFAVHPDSPDHLGDFVAMDSQTGAILWRRRSRLPYGTSALTTGGGLVFVGDFDRYFYALDIDDGQPLWHARLPMPLDGFPITYAVNGRQYIAVASGPGWFVAWPNVRDVFPDVRVPTGTPAIHVFALPGNIDGEQ